MANIFYAWELGAGFGHIGAFLPLARALRAHGHDVSCVVNSTATAARLLDKDGFAWLQAPVCPERHRPGPPLSYADILLRYGYADAADLSGTTVAWREVLRLTGADCLLADHAPTALLAARSLGLPAILYSSGFCVPPPRTPTPAMRDWQPVPVPRLLTLEKLACDNINRVLAHFQQPGIDGICRLFEVTEDTLLGFPELDHYPNRGTARYWGNLPDAGIGVPPNWPQVPGKKLFAYLRRECRHGEAVLAALRELGQPTLVFFPDAPEDFPQRFAATHLAFSRVPLDLAAVAHEADLAITYASLSTTTRFLLTGCPVLLLPWHLEQFMLARRVTTMGAGLVVDPDRPVVDLPDVLRRLLDTDDFAAHAQAFARKYAAFSQEVVVANLVRRIEEICQ